MAQEDKEKPIYTTPAYAPPRVDYGAMAQPEVSLYDEILNRYRNKVDPAMQAEQDKKLAYGKAFWAGANMLGNVISNWMNVDAVKAGAPSAQTYNGEAFNQMYNLWKDADTRLFAERRAAQERYDAAALAQARLQSAAAEKDAAQRLNQYNMQFRLEDEERKYQRGRVDKEADMKAQFAHQDELQRKRQEFEKAQQKERQDHNDAKQVDGLNMTFSDNNGKEYSLPAKTKNEALANKSKVTALVNQFVKDFPDLFTTTRTLRPSDKGYVSPTDRLNYREGVNDIKETITPEMIKDPAGFIDQYGLMNNPMFVNRFVDMFGEEYAPYQRHDVTKMPAKGQKNTVASFFE